MSVVIAGCKYLSKWFEGCHAYRSAEIMFYTFLKCYGLIYTLHDMELQIRKFGLDSLLCRGLSHLVLTMWAVAAWRMGRGEGKSTMNVILFLTFTTSLGSLCKGKRGLNIYSQCLYVVFSGSTSVSAPRSLTGY